VLPADGTVNPGNGSQFSHRTQSGRAQTNGVSPAQQKKFDALARRAPALLNKVRAGRMSAHRACIEAGIIKVLSPLDLAESLCRKLTDADRQHLITWLGAGIP